MYGKLKDSLHKIFMEKNSQNSMKYWYVITVCIEHHQICHRNAQIQEFWYKKGQLYFESELILEKILLVYLVGIICKQKRISIILIL